MYETPITVQGRLVADPVVRQGRNGPFTTLRVAQAERHPKRGEPGQWVDSETSYYDATVNRGMGENAARCLRKGHPVVVTGKLRVRQYQRPDGSWGKAVEIDVSAVGHDLRWGVTTFTRNGDLEPLLLESAPHEPGDPGRDPYTVEEDPGLLGGTASSPMSTGSGPLVAPVDEEAA